MRGSKHFIVTGTPGVGKSRFSRMLGRRIGLSVIDLNRLIKENRCVLNANRSCGSSVVDMEVATQLVRNLIKERPDENFIFESHLSHLIVDPKVVKLGFVLRCHPDVLSERLKRRGYPKPKIAENVLSEILDGCLIEAIERLGRDKVHELDATSLNLQELTDTAIQAIQGLVKESVGRIDWIKDLEREGLLLKYLSN